MLVPSIGTGPVHGPMVLDAADSTVGGMLSLNVNANRWRGGASPSRSCALVMNCGAGTMQEHHTRSLLKSQGSSRSCRQDTALGVHYGRNVVVAWKRSPVAVPGRDRRFRQSHPTVSCSPCHVHHKSVGGRLLKTRPWPATRKALQSVSPTLAPYRQRIATSTGESGVGGGAPAERGVPAPATRTYPKYTIDNDAPGQNVHDVTGYGPSPTRGGASRSRAKETQRGHGYARVHE